jgi:hypothetical protein
MISCDQTQTEVDSDLSNDTETAQIKGELRLMKLSRDTKSHTLSFGESNSFTERKEVPTQDMQVHEKNYYVCPTIRNPRLLLVIKIRVDVTKTMTDYDTSESSPKLSNDITQHPDKYPR